MRIQKVIEEMKEIFKEIPAGIEHTMKVLNNAEMIMDGETIVGKEREVISLAAILHDIGAVEALRKYGSFAAPYQEKEGPAVVQKILEKLQYDANIIDRVCYIVGNHHTPSKIDGIDFQIIWEADFLENLKIDVIQKEKQISKDTIDMNFKTNTGKQIAYNICSMKDKV